MIIAFLYICLAASPNQCDYKEVKVEPDACNIKQYHGEVRLKNEWTPVIFGVKCERIK